MDQNTFAIAFVGATAADANKYAADLAGVLRQIDPDVDAAPLRERNDSQDLGTTLAVVLGTASITAVAKGVAAWLARTGTKLEIRADGVVVATNLESGDAAKIAEAFSRRRSR